MWIYGWKLLTVSHYLAMFGGDWSRVSRDMKYLICRMTSQNQVIDWSVKFMSESYSRYVSNLSSLVSIGIVLVEIGF